MKSAKILGLAIALSSSSILAADANSALNTSQTTFNAAQTTAIEKIVHDYLVKNPQVMVEVAQSFQEQSMAKAKNKIQSGVEASKAALFAKNGIPSAGNPQGDVIMVEFFDNQCHVCRDMYPVIEQLLQDDPKLLVLYREWPIFGKDSIYATETAIAANKQNRYQEIHKAFLSTESALTADEVASIVDNLKLDKNRLEKDRASKEVAAQVTSNTKLAETLKLIGTPAFIFTNRSLSKISIIPGLASLDELKKAIAEVR